MVTCDMCVMSLCPGMFPRDHGMDEWCLAGTPGSRLSLTNRGRHLEWVPRSTMITMTEAVVDPDLTLSVAQYDNKWINLNCSIPFVPNNACFVFTSRYRDIPSYSGSGSCSRRICLLGLKFGSLNPVKYLSVTVCPNLTILRCLQSTNLSPCSMLKCG